MEALKGLILILNNETEELDDHLEAFKDLKQQAAEAFPVISENLKALTTTLSAEVESSVKDVKNLLNLYAEQISSITQSSIGSVTESITSYTTQLKDLSQEEQKAIRNNTETMRQGFEQALDNMNEILKESFGKFDEEMQEEITRTIQKMGSLLASLSEKFVSDYSEFSDVVKQWVELGK